MPCYTVRLVSVEFKAENKTILEEAARLLKWSYRLQGAYAQVGPVIVYFDRQQARARRQGDINLLKQAYTQAAVKTAAKKKGWTLDKWSTKAGTKQTTAVKY